MDYQSWIENFEGLAALYSFDIMPDGSFSEIRLMGVNKQNLGLFMRKKDAPEFYPGIPYREYWMDINFESYVYKSGSTGQPLYSYVNAHGVWLKGFYMPVTKPGTVSAGFREKEQGDEIRTVYCLYLMSYSRQVDADSMMQRSSEVASAVMNVSIKLSETQNYQQSLASAVGEIKKTFSAELCSLYTVDVNSRECSFITPYGENPEYLERFAAEMGRTPFEVAEAWEKDLAGSDCLLLENLSVVEERDPIWYRSLVNNGIRNLILYAIRYERTLVGFIWAANFTFDNIEIIKETFELSIFMIGSVLSNRQMMTKLQIMSTVDDLTQVSNRNAMNIRVDKLISCEDMPLLTLGVVFADLNGLKIVNDEGGHLAGDKLLQRAAALLKIAFGDYEIYRAGGDEFVVFCPDITREKLNQLVSQLRGLADNTEDVSFAVGAELFTGDFDIHKAMQTADRLMYADKESYYRQHPEKDRRNKNSSDMEHKGLL